MQLTADFRCTDHAVRSGSVAVSTTPPHHRNEVSRCLVLRPQCQHPVPTKNPIRGRQTRATDGEGDGSFGRRGESAPMARFGACSPGGGSAGGNSSMQRDGAASQPQQRSRAAIGSTTLGTLGLRLRRRVDTHDEDRRCAEKRRPYRGRVIRPGAVPEIVYPTRDAFAPRDNRKSRIAGAA